MDTVTLYYNGVELKVAGSSCMASIRMFVCPQGFFRVFKNLDRKRVSTITVRISKGPFKGSTLVRNIALQWNVDPSVIVHNETYFVSPLMFGLLQNFKSKRLYVSASHDS